MRSTRSAAPAEPVITVSGAMPLHQQMYAANSPMVNYVEPVPGTQTYSAASLMTNRTS